MRLYYILISLVLLLAFSTGYLVLFMQGASIATTAEVAQIEVLKREFAKAVFPQMSFDLKSTYSLAGQLELVDPIFSLMKPSKEKFKKYSEGKEGCSQLPPPKFSFVKSVKEVLWEEYRCAYRFRLPHNFFTRAPFMHSSGYSYAFLASHKKFSPYTRRRWVLDNLALFHVGELKSLREKLGSLPSLFGVFDGLGMTALQSVVKGEPTILSGPLLLFKDLSQSLSQGLTYKIYYRRSLEKFIEKSTFKIEPFESRKTCFYRDGEVCWSYTRDHVIKVISQSSLYLLGGILTTLFVILGMIFNRLKLQRKEDDRKRLALHVLTHELRTPIASMLLEIEQIKSKYELIPSDLEPPFLRLSDAVYRLQRLTEGSQKYLKVHNKGELVTFSNKEIPSVNDFFFEIMAQYKDQVGFSPLEKDFSMKMDVYWLGICVKNLIENALHHGKPPIELKLNRSSHHLIIHVEDQGECKFRNLSEMTQAFVKSPDSGGTGLGLNIVDKIIREMGGKLEYQSNPTRFKIIVKIKKGSK